MSTEDQARRRFCLGLRSASSIEMFLEKKPEPSKHCFILELSAPIVMDILGRLPLCTLVQCRFVCKNWRDLVLDPHFAKLCFSEVPTCVIVQNSMFYLGRFDEKEESVSYLSIPKIKTQVNLILENSCNGLVCLHHMSKPECIHIANPLTGEYLILPGFEEEDQGDVIRCLMGYCPNNKLYKVVRISCSCRICRISCCMNCKAEICTVGFGSWRSINGYLPCEIDIYIDGLYLNGALHWVSSPRDQSSNELIVTIELESERMLMLPPPPLHDFSLNRRGWRSKLDKLRDCLSILRSKERDHSDIEIWIMKEYGVKESWSKELVIKNPLYDWPFFNLITSLENGDIVISSCRQIDISDPKNQSFKTLMHHRKGEKSFPHVPSFISLRELTGNCSKV